MNATTARLPDGFSDLERWVDDWALPTERDRYFKLLSITVEGLRPFFDAMLPRADEAVSLLARRTVDQLSAQERVLYDLLLTFIEVAHPIELGWKQTNIEFTVEAERLRFHGPSAARYV